MLRMQLDGGDTLFDAIRRGTALCALSCLLLLSSCAFLPGSETPSVVQRPDAPQPRPEITVPEALPEPEPAEPPRPVGPSWEEGRSLPVALRPLEEGELELPIEGATGYATVPLGLWEKRPTELTVYLPPEPVQPPVPTPETQAPPASQASPDVAPPPMEDAVSAPSGVEGGDSGGEPRPTPEQPPVQTPVEGGAVEGIPDPDVVISDIPTGDPADAPVPSGSGTESPELPAPAVSVAPVTEPEPVPPPPDPFAGTKAVLPAGTAFQVLEEQEHWWKVRWKGGTGWVEHRFCMINLPDVIPSIVYRAINATGAQYQSAGYPLPGVTGEQLYPGAVDNPRLGREEFLMPALYATAKRLCQAQQAALQEGNTIILYEAFRPYSVQKAVRDGLTVLAKKQAEVQVGISTEPWSQTWFISNGRSNHQRGFAVDVGLAKVTQAGYVGSDEWSYLAVQSWEEYEMPTPIHELSIAAAVFTRPVDSLSTTAWRSATLTAGMDGPALGLQRYFVEAGMTPLASEWWHFNDLHAYEQVKNNMGKGDQKITVCLSALPEKNSA